MEMSFIFFFSWVQKKALGSEDQFLLVILPPVSSPRVSAASLIRLVRPVGRVAVTQKDR